MHRRPWHPGTPRTWLSTLLSAQRVLDLRAGDLRGCHARGLATLEPGVLLLQQALCLLLAFQLFQTSLLLLLLGQ